MSDTSRILLIDDEEAFLLSLSRVLRIRGFTVCCVQDGESGIDRFREDPPFDGIVLDLRMPGLDGLEVLARLLALDSEIPVILLTGHADLDSGIRAIREGAFDVLLKPCDVEDLVVRLRVLRTAKAIRKRPVLWPRRVVREVTRFDYPRVGPGASFRDAVELLHHAASAYSPQEGPPSGASVPERISDLVVVAGEDGGFLGALSRRDLIRGRLLRGAVSRRRRRDVQLGTISSRTPTASPVPTPLSSPVSGSDSCLPRNPSPSRRGT